MGKIQFKGYLKIDYLDWAMFTFDKSIFLPLIKLFSWQIYSNVGPLCIFEDINLEFINLFISPEFKKTSLISALIHKIFVSFYSRNCLDFGFNSTSNFILFLFKSETISLVCAIAKF